MTDIKDLEKTLWSAADKMRSNMDAAEYKHVVLGLIFLKYISDAFNELHDALFEGKGEHEGANAEDADEYLAQNVFFVPETARWKFLQDKAKQPEIGKLIDDAMDAIERINPNLKGVLPKIYADPDLNKQRLGELIDLIGTIGFNQEGHEAKDLLGRVYEYFLGQFADAEGKSGGQFYTPASIVKLLVGMLEPYTGRVYDGCCGSGGMFVQSEKFVKEHQGNIKDLSIYGQESNPTTLRLAKMNLAIRGIDARIELGDTFLHDKHKDLKADYIMANPPFNISDWSGEQLRDDARWKYGLPPVGNANYAWLQHFISKLSNTGTAGIVLANGSMNSNSGGEGEIRKSMIEAGLVDCMVELPSKLFFNTPISACLWILSKKRNINHNNEILFIDARHLGNMLNRKQRELSETDLVLISDTYHKWHNSNSNYKDTDGFCKSVEIAKIVNNNYNLAPSSYVSTIEQEVNIDIDIEDYNDKKLFEDINKNLEKNIQKISASWNSEKSNIRLENVFMLIKSAQELLTFSKSMYLTLVNNYFLDLNYKSSNQDVRKTELGEIPQSWSVKTFDSLFTERKQKIEDAGHCPQIYSVTNLGIQSREGKYSKELSKDNKNYKIAYYGDMVFGLSREIPNLDVFTDKIGAFSPAYSIFKPNDIRIGFIVGSIMRLKLMEQIDILKGGAREGKTLDKDKLKQKKFAIPSEEELSLLWGNELI